MKVQVQITENTSLLNFQNEKIRKFRVFSLIPTIKERLHENLPFILKDISEKLNIYNWEAEIYFKSEEHFVGMILNTRIFLKSLDNPSICGELLVENENYLNKASPSPNNTIKKGSLNFLITNDFALLLTFENIENRSLKYKLEFAALYLYDDNSSFKTGIEEIDFIYEKLKKFFELNRKSSKPFYCIWPVILISDSISWKLIAVLKNIFEGSNVHYNDKDNSIDNCNNFNFLQEILTILEDLNSFPMHLDSIVKVYKHLREIDLNEEMTDEELFEIMKYIKLLDY